MSASCSRRLNLTVSDQRGFGFKLQRFCNLEKSFIRPRGLYPPVTIAEMICSCSALMHTQIHACTHAPHTHTQHTHTHTHTHKYTHAGSRCAEHNMHSVQGENMTETDSSFNICRIHHRSSVHVAPGRFIYPYLLGQTVAVCACVYPRRKHSWIHES